MKISAFSYIRNGFKYDYPFLQSIQSILPICDEFVIAVGDSEDGTREAIVDIGDAKIKIIDTVWDEALRSNGKIFSQQANIALMETTGDWVFHIQADEVVHESNLQAILEHIKSVDGDQRVEGLLFDFLNFYGNYQYLNASRYQHKKEIRIFRNKLNVFSYRDSQGFRRYPSWEQYQNGHKGFKLNVKYIEIPVYHYSYVRPPKEMKKKAQYFARFWHNDSYIEEKFKQQKDFDFYNHDRVKPFTGSHPAVMNDIIQNRTDDFDPSRVGKPLDIKDKVAYFIEDRLNIRIGEYKNYKIV